MSRVENRFTCASSVGTTYQAVVAMDSVTQGNLLISIVNRTGSSANLRLYIAASTWGSSEPTGSDLVCALAYDTPIDPGEILKISGIILNGGEKLVARSSAASSLDVYVGGVKIT